MFKSNCIYSSQSKESCSQVFVLVVYFQMGSNMKKSIFDEHTSKALKSWHKHAKKKKERPPTQTLGGSPRDSVNAYFHPNGGDDARSSIEMIDAEALSSRTTANITASVDIP